MRVDRRYMAVPASLIGVMAMLASILCTGSAFPRPRIRLMREKGPHIEHRAATHYVAVRKTVSVANLGKELPSMWGDVHQWLGRKRIHATGPPMVRYLFVNMPARLDVEVGVPVAKAVKGEGSVVGGIMPSGNYVVLNYFGPYSGLVGANSALQAWAKKRGIKWDAMDSKAGVAWAGRAEFYVSDPQKESNPNRLETDIVYLAKGIKNP